MLPKNYNMGRQQSKCKEKSNTEKANLKVTYTWKKGILKFHAQTWPYHPPPYPHPRLLRPVTPQAKSFIAGYHGLDKPTLYIEVTVLQPLHPAKGAGWGSRVNTWGPHARNSGFWKPRFWSNTKLMGQLSMWLLSFLKQENPGGRETRHSHHLTAWCPRFSCKALPDLGSSHASSGKSLPESLISPIARVLISRLCLAPLGGVTPALGPSPPSHTAWVLSQVSLWERKPG